MEQRRVYAEMYPTDGEALKSIAQHVCVMIRNDNDASEVGAFDVMSAHPLGVPFPRQMAVLVKDDVPDARRLIAEKASV